MSSQDLHFIAGASFDVDEVKQRCYNESDPNNTAWKNLYSAMCTPEFCPNEKIRDGKYYKLLYPVSKAETEEMERRLELAENTQNNPDSQFSEILAEMKGIVDWSKTKHFCCSWKTLIAYLIIFPFIPLILMSGGKSIDIKETQKNIELVQSWEEKDDFFTLDDTKEFKVSYEDTYNSAYNYKYRVLSIINSRIEKERNRLDMAIPEEVDKIQKKLDNELALFEVENKKTAKEMKEEVLSEFEEDVDTYNNRKTMGHIIYILSIILIPLYLVSCYQYGYNISRFINFRESVDKLFKIGGGIAGAGAAVGTMVEVTHWSDGSETKQTTSGWPLVLAGLLLLLFTSCIVIIFLTINGLYYNYIKVNEKFNQKMNSLTTNNASDTMVEEKKGNKILGGIRRIISRNMSKMFVIDGRESCFSYLVFILLLTMIVVPILSMSSCLSANIFIIVTLCATMITASCRRVHDIGLSSKVLIVVLFVPFLIYLLPFIPGKKDANDYGPAPKNDFE